MTLARLCIFVQMRWTEPNTSLSVHTDRGDAEVIWEETLVFGEHRGLEAFGRRHVVVQNPSTMYIEWGYFLSHEVLILSSN